MVPARMLIGLAAAALLLVGCQQKPATLNPVSGKVYYKGALLRHDGVIVFSPDTSRGENGRIAVGKINPDGTYTLSTGDAPGCAAGWYRVTISSDSSVAVPYDPSPVALLPEKYRDPLLSQLQCEVKANRENHLDFNLD